MFPAVSNHSQTNARTLRTDLVSVPVRIKLRRMSGTNATPLDLPTPRIILSTFAHTLQLSVSGVDEYNQARGKTLEL